MSVRLGTWGRTFDAAGNKIVIPTCPAQTPGVPWLYDFLCQQMPDLAKHFDGLQLPPASKAQGGAGAGCDGYGVFDLRDIGSKNQQGSVQTHFGSKQSLLQLIAMAHRHGMSVFGDIPLHQMYGENAGPGVYKYLGSDGKTLNGRGETTPGWFDGETSWNVTTGTWEDPIPPFVTHDSVPGFDPAFGGRERSNQNSNPTGAVIADSLDYGDWFLRTTGLDGARFDDAKGTWPNFVAQFMQSRAMSGKPFYSEYFDNAYNSGNWATGYPMESRSGIEDFDAHFAMLNACNTGSAWALQGGGYFFYRPDLAYVFVENPDTDTSMGEAIIWSKLLAYAYAMTVPCREVIVYGKDYFPGSVWPGAYGLKTWIDNMAWVNRALAYGTFNQQVQPDGKSIVLQRNGQGGSVGTSPGLITVINFDTWNSKNIYIQRSGFWPGTQLHDFSGHHGDVYVNSDESVTLPAASNAYGNGQSFGFWSWVGMDGYVINLKSGTAVQQIEAAADLDVAPAPPGTAPYGDPIYVDAHTSITITPKDAPGLTFSVTSPDGAALIQTGNSFAATVAGWHVISSINPGTVSVPCLIEVQYTAPKEVI